MRAPIHPPRPVGRQGAPPAAVSAPDDAIADPQPMCRRPAMFPWRGQRLLDWQWAGTEMGCVLVRTTARCSGLRRRFGVLLRCACAGCCCAARTGCGLVRVRHRQAGILAAALRRHLAPSGPALAAGGAACSGRIPCRVGSQILAKHPAAVDGYGVINTGQTQASIYTHGHAQAQSKNSKRQQHEEWFGMEERKREERARRDDEKR